ncbi:hypothetical protein [Mycobacterium riyadhense]|uniref:hypothetical protein n=1 Tax=Mycobacterium riyadhense TaxID=486698 RepID=UPI001EF9DBA2|nr:hypothetical protein [Mycobacterium riyadhense]
MNLVHDFPLPHDDFMDCVLREANDLAFVHRVDVSLSECLRMTEQKTGASFGAACQGALSVTDDTRVPGWYHGGRSWAAAEAARRHRYALDVLATANPDPSAADDLRALAESITTLMR